MQPPNRSCRRSVEESENSAASYEYQDIENREPGTSNSFKSDNEFTSSETGKSSLMPQQRISELAESEELQYSSYVSPFSESTVSAGLSKIDEFIAMEAYKAKNYEIYKERNEELSLFEAQQKLKMLEHDLGVVKERNSCLETEILKLKEQIGEERKRRSDAQSEFRLAEFDIARYEEKSEIGQRQVALLREELCNEAVRYKTAIDELMATVQTMPIEQTTTGIIDKCTKIANSLEISNPLQTLTNPDMYELEEGSNIELSALSKSREGISSEDASPEELADN